VRGTIGDAEHFTCARQGRASGFCRGKDGPAGHAAFGLFFDLGLMAGSEPDDFIGSWFSVLGSWFPIFGSGDCEPWTMNRVCDDREFGQALFVVHVPAERGEERIEELGAELFFLVVGRDKDLSVLVEAVDQTFYQVGRRCAHCGKRIDVRCRKSSRRR